jgi:hypothetical protein
MSVGRVPLSLIASILGGLIVALANHWLTKRRDFRRKLTELRVEQLIDCWVKLERAALLPSRADSATVETVFNDADGAMARIRLLGTKQEIDLADSVQAKLSHGDSAAIAELLSELRAHLRRELDLQPVPRLENIFFRFHRVTE